MCLLDGFNPIKGKKLNRFPIHMNKSPPPHRKKILYLELSQKSTAKRTCSAEFWMNIKLLQKILIPVQFFSSNAEKKTTKLHKYYNYPVIDLCQLEN